MLNITHYQRNANQNYNERSPHTSKNGPLEKIYKKSKCWKGCREKGTFFYCSWEWRTVWRFLKKLEIELPYDPEISLLSIHTEETRRERDTCTPVFITALYIIARTWKQHRCPSADEQIRMLWYIYTMEYYSAIKKNTYRWLINT